MFEMDNNQMRVGLLWFDDDPKRGVSLKVKEAAERYLEKFGRWPNLCYVNPSTLPQATEGVHLDPLDGEYPQDVNHGLRILPNPLVLPDHFWVGENHHSEEKAPQSRR